MLNYLGRWMDRLKWQRLAPFEELADMLLKHLAVDVVHSPGIRAGAHRDHPARLHHLLVEALNNGRHLDEHGAGNHHEIGFTRRTANYFSPEARHVILAGDAGSHLDIAAGKTEIEGPNRILASPGDKILYAR